MDRIRVLLSEMPRTLRDAFKDALDGQPDIEVVGEVADPVELLLAVGETQADVVIAGALNSEAPGICSHLFSEYSQIKILTVEADGSTGVLYELWPHKMILGEVSPQRLPDMIRAAFLVQRV